MLSRHGIYQCPARGRREQQGAARGHASGDDVEEASERESGASAASAAAAFTSSLGRSRRRRTPHPRWTLPAPASTAC